MNRRDHPDAMPRRGRAARYRRIVITLIGAVVLVTVEWPIASVVLAADVPVKLAIEPVGEHGSFFERSLEPGSSAELIVDLANYGDAIVLARTFAADAYPLINGGFGARLRGEPITRTTTWVDYPTEIVDIEPGRALRRTFTVTVPTDAQPGEYITSIVIENEEPLTSGEGVTFNQFVRAAVAIVVVVPGETEAALQLGDARHSFLDGRSVVAVAIDNVGDLLLRPAGSFTITTDAGTTVDSRQVAMDSVYAHNSTWLEVVLDRSLAPGHYFANVDVTDLGRGGPAAGARPFVVGEDETPRSGSPVTLETDTVDLPVLGTVGTAPSALIAFGGGVLFCVVAIGAFTVTRRRRRETRSKG
jgi:hypothetical protein